MDLKDLKSAWDTYSSQEVDKHRLGKDSINDLLKNQTKSLVERIDRNIRIGMMVLLAFIAYVIVDDLYLSKLLIQDPIKYPSWMIPLDVFSNVLIVTTYLFFVLRYLRIKRSFSPDTHLKDLLTGILLTIKIYRRMFYLAVVILLINMVVSFAAGLYQGVKVKADSAFGGMENLAASKILTIIVVGLAILIPFVALTFYLLRGGFNNLYGRYLVRLNETLQELDETGDFE
jgi:hypothetical protein